MGEDCHDLKDGQIEFLHIWVEAMLMTIREHKNKDFVINQIRIISGLLYENACDFVQENSEREHEREAKHTP
jgi:hypothetical protein